MLINRIWKKQLFIYPIKSLRAVEVDTIELTDCGVRFDRCFALVEVPANTAGHEQHHDYDENQQQERQQQQRLKSQPPLARHLTIKRTFRLALFHPEIDATWSRLTIRYIDGERNDTVTVPLTPSYVEGATSFTLNIFGTLAVGVDMGDEAATFFTSNLGIATRLVYIGGSGHRKIPGVKYAPDYVERVVAGIPELSKTQRIRFADASPLLVTSTASEHEVQKRVPEQFRQQEDLILRFRPNIHVDVGDELPPFDEDQWRTLNIENGNSVITCVYPCVRCLSINADTLTGDMSQRSRQLYGLLARDRRVNKALPHKPVFGQYAFGTPYGATLRVRDLVTITERSDTSRAPSTGP